MNPLAHQSSPKACWGAGTVRMDAQTLSLAPWSLYSGEGTRTANQPTKKELKINSNKGYAEFGYSNKKRKLMAIWRQPPGERSALG